MAHAQDIDEVVPGVSVWQAYESEVRSDLFSTAIQTRTGTFVIDPIPLSPNGRFRLGMGRKVAGICATNANHARATAEFAAAFCVPIYVHHELCKTADFPQAIGVQDGEMLAEGLTGIMLDGGPMGEMALHCNENGGTMILGDALINFEPHGFGLLPVKYCRDFRLMRQSSRKLLDYAFDRMFFAHGTPILSGAHARVKRLLARTH